MARLVISHASIGKEEKNSQLPGAHSRPQSLPSPQVSLSCAILVTSLANPVASLASGILVAEPCQPCWPATPGGMWEIEVLSGTYPAHGPLCRWGISNRHRTVSAGPVRRTAAAAHSNIQLSVCCILTWRIFCSGITR